MKIPEHPWCLVILHDRQGRVVVQEQALRWDRWPGIMIRGDRYFAFSRNEGPVAYYYERTVHFLPCPRESAHA